MRSRSIFFVMLFVAGIFVLPHLAQAAIPFFGPIIPKAIGTYQTEVCPASWGLLIQVINNIIELLITIAIVFIAPLMIAYSGFLLVINQGNTERLSEAKRLLTNTIVGIVIALSAWLIVDAIMVTLYNGEFGTWSSLVSGKSNDLCLEQKGALPSEGLQQVVSAPPSLNVVTGVSGTATLSASQIQDRATAALAYKEKVCAEASAQNIATQCGVLLGILGVESGGNPAAGSGAGAIGLMQLMPTTAANSGVTACVGSTDANPSAACRAALKTPDISIKAGVKNYATLYNQFDGNQKNAIAAYNAGNGTGFTKDGKKQAFAPSSDCPGMYAWECTANAGGFTETQRYVPNVLAVAQQTGV